MKDREALLQEIFQEVLALSNCELCQYRVKNNYFPVVGEGNVNARIMLIGEAPGVNEAKTGKPFCGRAGKVLDTLLDNSGIKREEVYITSIVKDRPPKNRDPRLDEIVLYAPYLDRQIEIIKPEVVATLGRFSMEYIMKRYGLESELAPISELHGKVFQTTKFKVITLYHPAAAIYNQKLMDTLKHDFAPLALL